MCSHVLSERLLIPSTDPRLDYAPDFLAVAYINDKLFSFNMENAGCGECRRSLLFLKETASVTTMISLLPARVLLGMLPVPVPIITVYSCQFPVLQN